MTLVPDHMEVFGVACPIEWADDGPEAFANMAESLLKDIPEDKRVEVAKGLIQKYENEKYERLKRDQQPLPIVDEEEYEKEYREGEEGRGRGGRGGCGGRGGRRGREGRGREGRDGGGGKRAKQGTGQGR